MEPNRKSRRFNEYFKPGSMFRLPLFHTEHSGDLCQPLVERLSPQKHTLGPNVSKFVRYFESSPCSLQKEMDDCPIVIGDYVTKSSLLPKSCSKTKCVNPCVYTSKPTETYSRKDPQTNNSRHGIKRDVLCSQENLTDDQRSESSSMGCINSMLNENGSHLNQPKTEFGKQSLPVIMVSDSEKPPYQLNLLSENPTSFKPCSSKCHNWIHKSCDNLNSNERRLRNIEKDLHNVIAEHEQIVNKHLVLTKQQRSWSLDNIADKSGNSHPWKFLGRLKNAISSSTSDISVRGRRKKPTYRLHRSFELPCACQHGECSCRIVSIATGLKSNTFSVAMQETLVKLCDFNGNVLESVDIGATIDDLAMSDNGDLYISCPKAQRIKVIKRCNPGIVSVFLDLRNTQWFPRGLTIHGDGSVIACLALSSWAHPTDKATESRLIKLETETDSKRLNTSLITEEKCFGYPIRVSVNTKSEFAVSDSGLRSIFLLNSCGLVIAKFSEINGIRVCSPLALGFDKNDHFIIVHGAQPTVFSVKIDGSPFTAREVTMGVSENSVLSQFAISAMAFDLQENMIMGSGSGTVYIIKES